MSVWGVPEYFTEGGAVGAWGLGHEQKLVKQPQREAGAPGRREKEHWAPGGTGPRPGMVGDSLKRNQGSSS